MLISVLLLALLAVAADRGAAYLAGRQVAQRIQLSEGLARRPSVTMRGVPFLTQAIQGHYRQVDVEVAGLRRGDLRIDRLAASLLGARVALQDVVHQSVAQVPVDGVRASVRLTYADLDEALRGRGLSVSPQEGNRVRVTGMVSVLGQIVRASAVSDVRVSGESVVATARTVNVGSRLADQALSAVVGGRLNFTVMPRALPFGLRIHQVQANQDGLVVTADAGPAVLRAS